MREIKFRAWFPKEKFMAQCHTIACENGTHTLYIPKDGKMARLLHKKDYFEAGAGECELMQFTNIKSKSGVEIYEGDICNFICNDQVINWPPQAKYIKKQAIFEVIWDKENARFYPNILSGDRKSQTGKMEDRIEFQYTEIVGNIYENSELLK